jgi:hypothetical protein
MRTFLSFIVLAALAGPARAQSMLQLYGKTGYLGEYELSGTVSEHISNGRREFSSPLVVKHVGLCAHAGPQETTNQIRLQIDGASQRVTATLVFDGVECTYRELSQNLITAPWIARIRPVFRSDCGPNERARASSINARCQIEPAQQQTIDIADGYPLRRSAPQRIELVSRDKDFSLQCRPRPE